MERLRDRFAKRGMTMPEINRRQAMVPHGAEVLPNANGTAPGLWLERDDRAIVLLPGPPREMKPMLEAVIAERLVSKSKSSGLFRRVLKITGRAESDVDAQASPVYTRWTTQVTPISTTILAVLGQIELHLTAEASDKAAADAVLDPAVTELQTLLGPSVYSTDGRSLETVVGDLLREYKMNIAVAESCTGGLLASRLTDVPGSSEYVDRGVVCYSNQSKIDLAGVPPPIIEQHGAVSEPVARAMAEGIKSRAGTRIGVGITGIAGPGGGTPEKPVGTVFIGLATASRTVVVKQYNPLDRESFKQLTCQQAMEMLRRAVLKAG